MDWLLLTLIAFICFALVFYVQQRLYARSEVQLPYQLKPALLRPAQTALLEHLQRSHGERVLILSQIRANQVVDITALPRRSYWYRAMNRLAPLHFDHVLCRREDALPLCAIRLLDGAHPADELLPEVCQAVGLPLVDLRVDELEQYGRISEKIDPVLEARQSTRPAAEPE